MAYVKTTWKNREVANPRTFTMVENQDGTVTLIPAEGQVFEEGTPIVAAVMNNIEDGVDTAHNNLGTHESIDASTSQKGHVQLATAAEVTTGTDTIKAVTPAGAKVELDKKVPTSRTINSKALSTDITLTAADVGAATTAQGTKADNALPKAGGTMTGAINMNDKVLEKPEIKNYKETATVATGVTGTKALDLSAGNVFDMTLSGPTTFAFNNPPASGKAGSFTLIIRQPSTLRAITWPSSVKWNEDEIPEFVKSKAAVLTFVTMNGGSRWYGMVAGTEFTL